MPSKTDSRIDNVSRICYPIFTLRRKKLGSRTEGGIHLDENDLGRTGKTGLLYNIHHPIDPERFSGTAHDYVGVVEKIRDYAEY